MKPQYQQHQSSTLIKDMLKRVILLLLLIYPLFSTALVTISAYTAPVVDLSQTLTPTQLSQLTTQILNIEKTSEQGTQLAVLLVPTTEEESIEQFATRVFDNWRIGAQKKDNGLLLVIAKQDKTLRIEVGYGLEGNITDIQAGTIIRHTIIPYFKQDQYFNGIQAGLEKMSLLLTHEESEKNSSCENITDYFHQIIFIAFFIPVTLFTAISRLSLGKKPTKVTHLIHYILSVFGINSLSFLLGSRYGVSSFWMLLIFSVSLFFCGFLSILLCNIIKPQKNDRYYNRNSFSRKNNSSQIGGFRGGGGRSGGGGASGRW